MRRTILKGTDIETSVLGFGCSGLMGVGAQPEREALLGRALDLGITHFDVARFYGLGQAESALGRFVRSRRDRVTVATKFGIDPMPLIVGGASRVLGKLGAKGLAHRIESSGVERRTHRFSVADARTALNDSLSRLGLETIDVYLLHDCAPEDVRNDDLQTFLQGAKREGKIRAFGVATDIDAVLRIAEDRPGLAEVVQFENSALSRDIDRLPKGEARATITHRALSENLSRLRKRLDETPELAKTWSTELGIDLTDPKVLADAMLAYAAAANPNGVVLFSTTKRERVDSNARAFESPVLEPAQALRFAELAGGVR